MGKDIDQPAEGIAREETPDAPGLHRRPVFDRQPGRADPPKHRIEIIDLDRQVGDRVPDPPSVAMLICGADQASAAKATIQPWSKTRRMPRIHTQNTGVEGFGIGRPVGRDIRGDPLHRHGLASP